MTENGVSPAGRVLREAIDLALEERSPYPERSAFFDADSPGLGKRIWRAIGEGYAVVLVADDGSTRILSALEPR